jgi:[FeFe] hydrogenase H-cluster maturation GTPase HydF
VLFIDTAGIDDTGALGEMRIEKTRRVIDRTDLGIIISDSGNWGDFENYLSREFRERKVPVVAVFNKADRNEPDTSLLSRLEQEHVRFVKTVASSGEGILDFRQALLDSVPDEFLREPDLMGDIVGPGEFAVLVVPIDKEAPKGRLILPQVQAIRNLLDNDAYCVIVKERELRSALDKLNSPPKIVVTDSQAFLKVSGDVPAGIFMTSFSILFARMQGDLPEMVRGAMAIDKLKKDDRVLVAEACSHHPIADDIGRVKIPRWIMQYVGGRIYFDQVQGHDFPGDLSDYKLVIHCGACMWNRREMLSRILYCRNAGLPITNYGLTIAYSLGIFERALEPFPAALDIYKTATEKAGP